MSRNVLRAGLGAQTQADDQKKKEGQGKPDEKTVTMTGCLRAGDTPGSFVLANVKMDEPIKSSMPPPPTAPPTTPPPTDPPSTPPPTPTAPPPPEPGAIGTSGAEGETVRLIGAPAGMDLTQHVGHTVKVTGMLAAPAKDKPAGTSGGAAAKSAKSINVKSVAHVSDKCPM
jgi:hypothetical protein